MVVGINELTATTNAGKSLAILIAMVRLTSRASLKATGRHHQASACAVSPRQPPWSINLNETHKTLKKHNF